MPRSRSAAGRDRDAPRCVCGTPDVFLSVVVHPLTVEVDVYMFPYAVFDDSVLCSMFSTDLSCSCGCCMDAGRGPASWEQAH
jgi:hypothetical protein